MPWKTALESSEQLLILRFQVVIGVQPQDIILGSLAEGKVPGRREILDPRKIINHRSKGRGNFFGPVR
ncbi:hypothetical protein D3C76_1775130 [compost metagenome]